MLVQVLTTLSTLLALALCSPSAELSPSSAFSPYFVVADFEAFRAAPAYPEMHSRAVFNLTLVHPDPAQRWSTMCLAHMASDLCNTTDYLRCEPVGDAAHADERLRFKFSANLDSVEIMRLWTYQGMHMKTTASEGTYWNKDGKDANVTESQYGQLYKRPAEWVFAWRSTVG
ncbi:uncharacterized protein EKO05_0004013 [Ascochyta rabiei]|uniref:Uncharacterized protein n=1 Tax=Didymella rabiei TaxID=5454 RepID=A0A162XZY1_DIDRA|nr:uncharacterized protein EKO05_0004013 [Ascochyta rabiei]KZM19759.1 hypothetical protein ST47_g9298 [Ascochyta rabiei]UPX13507.1 hypothetical protein EKO05_0004013 [Ascochyta rabiei]